MPKLRVEQGIIHSGAEKITSADGSQTLSSLRPVNGYARSLQEAVGASERSDIHSHSPRRGPFADYSGWGHKRTHNVHGYRACCSTVGNSP